MLENFIKTYAPANLETTYKHTAMVSHGGVVIGLALDSEQQFWYTVLDLENTDIDSPIDVNYWFKEPVPLAFPKELTQVGYSIAGNQMIPDPTTQTLSDGSVEVKPDKDKTLEEKFLASTARSTADAPFQVISDGQFIYLFRQAIAANHPQNVQVGDVSVVNSTLLVDRFVFVGNEFKPKLEVRYQRSRHKDRPLNRKDSLSNQDLEGKPFYEPTQELDMVRNLVDGRFSVEILPTAIPNIRRWQIFAHNQQTGAIDSFNVERSSDGLFNPRGTQFYTCESHPDVFEPQPGKCPDCGAELVPKLTKEGFAESALAFDGSSHWVEAGAINLSGSALTIECWFKGSQFQSIITQQQGDRLIGMGVDGKYVLSNDGGVAGGLAIDPRANDGAWHHLAMTWRQNADNGFTSYFDGRVASRRASANLPIPAIDAALLIGSLAGQNLVNGTIDEVRIWNRSRSSSEIRADLNRRLVGNEDGLVAYWRFDEGSGSVVRDQTDHAHHGQIRGTPQWVDSDAPVGDNPGVNRDSFTVDGRLIAGGLSSLLYHQQEKVQSGYSQEAKPLKKAARLMLAVTTQQAGEDKRCIAALDFAVSREGKLAQVPDCLQLPVLGQSQAVGSINDLLDRRSALEVELVELVRQIEELKSQIEQLKAQSGDWERDLRFYDRQMRQALWKLQDNLRQGSDLQSSLESLISRFADQASEIEPIEPWDFDDYIDRYRYRSYGDRDSDSVIQLIQRVISVLNSVEALESFLESFEDLARDAADRRRYDRYGYRHKDDEAWTDLHDWSSSKKDRLAENNYRVRLAELTQRLSDLEADRLKKQAALEIIRKQQLGEVRVPMELLHTDRFGLTVSGGLLSFAYTNDSPLLFDSAIGNLGLYFRGATNDQFFAAYFDTLTERAVYGLPATAGQVVLTARRAEAVMDATAITVSDGNQPTTCQLQFSNPDWQLTETWPDLPRDLAALVAIFNGGGSSDPEDPYHYDYDRVTLSQGDKSIDKGSLFFIMARGHARGELQNTPAPLTLDGISTRVNEWIADSQGNALYLNGKNALVTKPDAVALDRFDTLSNLTLETWVKPAVLGAGQLTRLLSHQSTRSRYGLALKSTSGSEPVFQVIAGVGEAIAQTEAALAMTEWTHVAAAFRQSFALQFDGKDDYLNAGKAEDLNITQDLTIEVFLLPFELGQERGILTKGRLDDGGDQDVPYALSIGADGRLIFAFEKTNHAKEKCQSDRALVAGQFAKVAVTRTQGTDKQENRVKKVLGGQEQEVIESVTVSQWQEVRFFINGQLAGSKRYTEVTPGITDQPLELGKAYRDGGAPSFFKGILGEVRLWSVARSPGDLGKAVKGSERGLSAWWCFEENAGNTAFDSKGSNHANRSGARWVKNPDPEGSSLVIYVNGVSQKTRSADGPLNYGDQTFTLGGYRSNGAPQELFHGVLEETRLWKTTRTQEQIQDNLFRRVLGDRKDLLAYYQFDAGTDDQLPDCSGRANHLSVSNADWRISNAPVSYETPQVRSALAGVQTAFHGQIHSRPAVQEYGDVQYNSDKELIGTMKRCYAYIKEGEWHLITGFKIGNIITEWIGQAQYDPQIVGFIEGAPPVPSENCTIDADEEYGGGSLVEVVEAESVQYTLSASRESTLDAAFKMAASIGGGTGTEIITAPFGFGISQEIVDLDFTAKLEGAMEISNSWSNESSVSTGKNVSKNMRVKGVGYWEPDGQILNQAIGKRFVFNNTGFALVQSDTADIFALRMEHNNVLIAFRFQPNPDIPKDWNLVPFQMNPRYVCQGTLDGRVGMDDNGNVYDPNYKNARDYGEYSYFKPKEAYALKNRIRRDEEELKTYYENFSTSPLDADRAGKGAAIGAGVGAIAGPLGMAAGAAVGGLIGGLTGDKRLPQKLAKRNLVNTYVWTAEGGFFAETTELADSMSETVGGSFSLQGAVTGGFGMDIEIFGLGIAFEMEASIGGSLNLTKSKTRDSERSFSLNVELEVPDNIQQYRDGNPIYDSQGKPVLQPGKVDAYRFMTFYLEPSVQNFDTFINKVVDPNWLAESKHPNAAAIRSAIKGQQKAKKDTEKSIPWRVLHRVTFVSRVLPEIPPDKTPQTPEETIRAADIDSNYELIKRLEPFVGDQVDDFTQFTDAVRGAIDTYMPELKPAKEYIVEYMCQYYQVFN